MPLAVCFEPSGNYLSQCYRNAPDASSATLVTPTSGGLTTGIDAVPQPANRRAGHLSTKVGRPAGISAQTRKPVKNVVTRW